MEPNFPAEPGPRHHTASTSLLFIPHYLSFSGKQWTLDHFWGTNTDGEHINQVHQGRNPKERVQRRGCRICGFLPTYKKASESVWNCILCKTSAHRFSTCDSNATWKTAVETMCSLVIFPGICVPTATCCESHFNEGKGITSLWCSLSHTLELEMVVEVPQEIHGKCPSTTTRP